MSLHFARDIKWDAMCPQISLALAVASECYGEEDEDCYVSGLDRHAKGVVPGSKEDFAINGFHSGGRAADLSVQRVNGGGAIPDDKMDRIFDKLNMRLGRVGGSPFDVLDERRPRSDSPGWTGPHIHIEFQPRQGDTMSVRAKFRCTTKTGNSVVLEPDYSDPVNKAWALGTPTGSVQMSIDNPPALAQFDVGKFYFIDFTPV